MLCIITLFLRSLREWLAPVNSTWSISQAPSAGMPWAGCSGWTAAAQPPAQSNNEDPAHLTSATACFPQLVWQSHHWNERHRSPELPEDPPAGQEQVGCLHWPHKLNQLRKMPDLSTLSCLSCPITKVSQRKLSTFWVVMHLSLYFCLHPSWRTIRML